MPTPAATMKTHHSKNNNDYNQHRMKDGDRRQRDFDYGGMKNQRTNYQKQQLRGEDNLPASEKSFLRKNLDPETVQYYTEISSLLEKSTTDTEERAILCSNALEESRGKEFQLVCDKVFSRLFENLISSCERDQLCQFLLRCVKVFPSISMDQSGSHVAEAALKSLALALQDCDARTESHRVIQEALTNICKTILRLLKGNDEAVVKVITALLDCHGKNILKEGNILEDASRQNVLDLIMDPASSHLMEVILEVAPGYMYMEILNRFFRHSLLEIASHKSGNFVVQSLISSSRDEGQVNMIWGELASKFPELLKDRKSGVVASLIAACRRFHTHERECCRALAHAVNLDSASPNCIVPHILHLEDFSCNGRGGDWQWPSGNKMSVLGCLMLQNIFSYPNDFIQQFCSSIASMEIDYILEAAKDPGGSRVIEAFLSSKAPLKHKLRLISNFRGHFGKLAQQSSSSFTVSKCFLAADVALKEVIASELTLVQAELSRLKHGPHLLKTCDITRFSKGPEQWRSSQSSKQSTRQAFSEVFCSDVETRHEDINEFVSLDEEVKEVVKKKGKNKRNRELDNIQIELEKNFLNKQGESNLENSMAELGFDMHKLSKIKDANGKSRSNEKKSDDHKVKMAKKVPSVLEGDSIQKPGRDDIDEIFSKNSKTNKSITGMKVNEVHTNSISIVPDQPCIDPSLSNVLNLLERGSKRKKRGHSKDPSTSSNKKHKQGKQMVYI